MHRFEVVFETAIYYSVIVDADDADEAAESALETKFPPQIAVPNGFEVNDAWFVGGTVRVRDDD